MRKMLTKGDDFTDAAGKRFRGMTALDLNAEFKHYPEFAKARASTQLQHLLQKEGLNIKVVSGYRDGKGKSLKVWTV